MAKITVIGTGYVGLVAGTMFAEAGHSVLCCDVDVKKVEMLKEGRCTIYEEGLDALLLSNIGRGTLHFTSDIPAGVQQGDIIFIAVGTPQSDDGHADLSFVHSVAHDIGKYMNGDKVVVDKSTVPVGTAKAVARIIRDELAARDVEYGYEVVSNPEFLREGSSVYDFKYPDRVVIGCRSDHAFETISGIYRALIGDEAPIVRVEPETAEMIKYASNAFLAVKIAYTNELACLCEKVGADIEDVTQGMGMDSRISPHFMQAGPGYGGSCFPKDTMAICQTADAHGLDLQVIKAAIRANEGQKLHMVRKIERAMGPLSGKTLAILGVAFKPGTDDMRDAPSLVIVPELIKRGARVKIYDPQCRREMKWRFQDVLDSLEICADEYAAMQDADGAVLLTHWPQFKELDFKKARSVMRGEYFFDLRNLYKDKDIAQHGFTYHCVGKG